MSRLHPDPGLSAPTTPSAYLERHILTLLDQGLPSTFDIFHNLPWSAMHQGQQHFGEFDLVVVSPAGQLLLLEVKAGVVQAEGERLTKQYGAPGAHGPKDIGHQVRRMHAALLSRIQSGDLPGVHVGTLLVLPDARVQAGVAAYPRERIVDADQMDQLCTHVRQAFPLSGGVDAAQRQRVLDFLANRFDLVPDVATRIGALQSATTQLASGLATWMLRLSHPDQQYQVEATAGSGKTQLALALLRQADARGEPARYVCFNRPLADHLARLAPARCEVTTFHQLCREQAERSGLALDFSDPQVYARMTETFVQQAASQPARLGLLIIDESQDLEPDWVGALGQALREDGSLYVLGDSQQQLYDREPFVLPGAVQVRCLDNFRSPQRVVEVINALGLVPEAVLARSAFVGGTPDFHTFRDGDAGDAVAQVDACLRRLWEQGWTPEQVAVISHRGVQQSVTLQQAVLGGQPTRRFTGRYDAAGNPLWTDGTLLVDSVYRFKGQSAPAVVLCDVDFETLTDKERRKLFVGLTRAQVRVEVVMSERAAGALLGV